MGKVTILTLGGLGCVHNWTGETVRFLDRISEVSRGHSRQWGHYPVQAEGPNDMKWQVGCGSHECKAAENAVSDEIVHQYGM